VSFVGVEQVESTIAQKPANHVRRRQSKHGARDLVNVDSLSLRAAAQRRPLCSEKLRGVAAFVQALQQQQRLALPTAPFRFQIHNEGNHARAPLAPFCAANCPSFLYLRRTPRAAIRAISQPR